MQYLDPPDRAYAFSRRGNQRGVPEGSLRCRDCGEVKPVTLEHWRRAAGLRMAQPCLTCRPKRITR